MPCESPTDTWISSTWRDLFEEDAVGNGLWRGWFDVMWAADSGRTAGTAGAAASTGDTAALVSRLTLEEKAALCAGRDFWTLHGVPRLGLPSIWVADGPHGLRKQPRSDNVSLTDNVPATCFPTAAALASTWDRGLLREIGRAIGLEARSHGVSVVLGPGVNIKRSPLCGRNFEYFSEDPLLTGELAAALIEGLQSVGVGASIKHFAVNNQETRRFSIDAVVDERALREIYLAPFERAVKKAKPWTVMAAYNRVNGRYCTEHEELLTHILRHEWGFDGVVVSDWGAVDDRIAALAAGLDLEMPGTGPAAAARIVDAVRSGSLAEAVVDRAAGRVVELIRKAASAATPPDWRQDGAPQADAQRQVAPARAGRTYDAEAHHDLARLAAAEGIVLLKNDGPILPLNAAQSVAVVGAMAKHPRYQGAGSSVITPTKLDNAYDALAARLGADRVAYAAGYDLSHDMPGDERDPDPALIAEARKAARSADVVVVFAGLPAVYETEGLDRTSLSLPVSHDALIEAVAEANPNVVVVLNNGGPVAMPWIEQVPAVIEAYLGGQAGGSAVAQVLLGEVNPSGKLAETFPLRWEDHPAHAFFPGGPRTVEYRESVYVGYRYYDSAGKDVLFPFGHGLSYTEFSYENLRLSASHVGEGERLEVTVSVTNTGQRPGKEIVQLYVRDVHSTVFRPEQELKDFAKIALQPGETKDVVFSLDRWAFAYWDAERGDWRVEPGEFELRVGASSRDIRLSKIVSVGREAGEEKQPAGPDAPESPKPPEAEATAITSGTAATASMELTASAGAASATAETQVTAATQATAAPVGTGGAEQAPLAEYYDLRTHHTFSAAGFTALYGRALPPNQPERRGHYTLNTPLGDMRDSWAVRLFLAVAPRAARLFLKDDADSPTTRRMGQILAQMPLRALVMGGAAGLNRTILNGMLDIFNGQFVRGVRRVVRGLVARR